MDINSALSAQPETPQIAKTVPPQDLRVVTPELAAVWSHLNEQDVWRPLGHKNFQKAAATPKQLEIAQDLADFKQEIVAKKWLQPAGLYQFFQAQLNDQTLEIYTKNNPSVLEKFIFPRLASGRSLNDYFSSTQATTLGLMVLTCGHGVAEKIALLKAENQYFKALALYALAVATVEALAEYVQQEIRQQLAQNVQRFSLGYPLCPDLTDQAKLWRLLQPDRHLGVTLTENYLMVPEASISAFVIRQ